MNCVTCGKEIALDRIIVETVSHAEVGGLCQECEETEFGELLTNTTWHRESGCSLCPRDGHYVLPHLDCLIEYMDNRTEVEYSITDESIELCDQHFHSIVKIPLSTESLLHSDSPATT